VTYLLGQPAMLLQLWQFFHTKLKLDSGWVVTKMHQKVPGHIVNCKIPRGDTPGPYHGGGSEWRRGGYEGKG